MNISSFDLQAVPANYDIFDYDFQLAPIVITHKVFSSGNTIVVTLNGDLTEDRIMELQGRIDDLATEFCNETSEQIETDFCGF